MKNQNLCLILFLGIILQSCWPTTGPMDDDFVQAESRYEPVVMDRSVFEKSVVLANSLSIGTSGKIYIKDNLLFINEVKKGFHIYDNSDPSSPKAIRFLAAPGSTDLAIRNDMVYINQARDLIAVEYDGAKNSISLTKRIPDTFPEMLSPDGFFPFDLPENSVVVDWKLKD
ncbi:MAG: hypothetical protein WA913_15095 [Pricia sp.]